MNRCLTFVAVITLLVPPAWSAEQAMKRVDFSFVKALDLAGEPIRFAQNEDRAGTVFVFISPDCPLSRQYIPELNRLAASDPAQEVAFFGVVSDRTLDRISAQKFGEEFKIQFPVLFDATGELAELLQPSHVPQAFMVDSQGAILYRGRINDLYADVNKRKAEATEHDLLNAMTTLAAGRTMEPRMTETVGCLFENSSSLEADGEVTYTRDIAPILFANCSECHRPGEVAPFSLLTYEDASKRAQWLSEVTSSGLMPPWRAEIGHGHFLDERRLSETEIRLIQKWVESGTPRGNDADMPPQPQYPEGWRLGTPDLIVEAPDFVTVPADGPDIFHHWVMPIEIPEGKTLIGFEFHPGNPAVVHHAVLGLDSTGGSRRRDAETPEPGYRSSGSIEGSMSAFVGVWTPGVTPRFYPENVGLAVSDNTDLLLQLHIHPSGKEETDKSSVALYFSDKPREEMKTQSIFITGSLIIDIEPGDDNYQVKSSITLPTDITLTSVFPHLHLIGKDVRVIATLPDGEALPLIWIKDWNFYWQDIYTYREPVHLPKGTRVDLLAHYDNSAANPFNPSDPPQRVLFGNDSDDEMCFVIFQSIDNGRGSMQRMAPAMMTSFVREWNEADLSMDAKEYIVDEAIKLFGGGRGRGGAEMLRRVLLGGNRKTERNETPEDAKPSVADPKAG